MGSTRPRPDGSETRRTARLKRKLLPFKALAKQSQRIDGNLAEAVNLHRAQRILAGVSFLLLSATPHVCSLLARRPPLQSRSFS
jgi:hypothetical protein